MIGEQAVSLLRQYQTLAVGLLGFAGVMFTLSRNARLSRLQHVRQVQHERTVVRVALKAELEVTAGSYRDRIERLDAPDAGKAGGVYLPLNTTDQVYKSMIASLGLLSDSQVQAVLKAYALVQCLPERLNFLAEDPMADLPLSPLMHRDKEWTPPPGYLWFSAKSMPQIARMHRNHLREIDAAITALSG